MSSLPITCPCCGFANDPGMECCHHCSQLLSTKTSSTSVPPPSRLRPRLSRRTILLSVAAGVVALIPGGYLTYRWLTDPHILTYAKQSMFEGIQDASWSPDGTRVASAAEADNGAVQIWNATTGKKLVTCTLEPPIQGELPLIGPWDAGGKRVIWSGDGKRVLAFVGSGGKQLVQIWNAASGQRVHSFPVIQSPPLTAKGGDELRMTAWALNERYLAVARGFLLSSENSFVEIWDIVTGSKIATFETDGQASGMSSGRVNQVNPIVWAPDEKKLALGYSTEEGFFYAVWDALAGKRISPFRFMADSASDLAWSPGGKSLVTVNYDVKIGSKVTQYDVKTGNTITEYPVESYPFALAWSPDGKRVAVTSYTAHPYWVPIYGSLSVFDASSGERLAQYDQGRFDTRVNAMGQMAWSPNGKYLLVLNGQIDIWRMESL